MMHHRARLGLVAFGFILVAAANGQYVETTLRLPDSIGVLRSPDRLLANPLNNTVFVSGATPALVVLDGTSGQAVARVDLPTAVSALCLDSADNRVYCASRESAHVYAVDADRGRLTAVIRTPCPMTELCYSRTSNRVYASGGYSSSLHVIDCSADTLAAAIPVGDYPTALCWNPTANKLYCGVSSSGEVKVVDCSADTVLTTLRLFVRGFSRMLYSPAGNRLYCPDYTFNELAVIDAGADTLITWLRTGQRPGLLCLNPARNKVYVISHHSFEVDVFDDLTGAALGYFTLPGDVADLVCDPARDRIFCAAGSLLVIDCGLDSVVADINLGPAVSTVAGLGATGRVYATGRYGYEVIGLDAQTLQVASRTSLWFSLAGVCYSTVSDKLYCAGEDVGRLEVFAGASHERLGSIPGPARPQALLYVADVDKVYCAGRDATGYGVLYIVDCSADTLTAIVSDGFSFNQLLYNPVSHKVYCASSTDGAILGFDARTDSLVSFIEGEYFEALAFNPDDNKLYAIGWNGGQAAIFDAGPDTLLATVTLAADPSAACYLPASNSVACGSHSSLFLTVIDGATNQVRQFLRTPDVTHRLIYAGARNRLCTSGSYTLGRLSVFDGTTGTLLGSIACGPGFGPLGYDSIADRVYCLRPDHDSVTVVDLSSLTVEKQLEAGRSPSALAWSPRHRRTYVANFGDATVSVIRDTFVTAIAGSPVGSPSRAPATVVRDVLWLPRDMTEIRSGIPDRVPGLALLDPTGRHVTELRPGTNDLGRLAPGVYFVRRADSGTTARIVLVR